MSRREEILAAAQNAFLKFGIEKITLDDIARECGINKTALYYYFKNKEEILSEMLLNKIDDFEKRIRQEVLKKDNVKDRLRTYMLLKINMMRENIPFFRLFENEGLSLKARKFLEENRKKIMDTDFCLIKDVLQQGIKNHKISYKLNNSLVLMILGVTYGTFIGKFIEEEDWDMEAMIHTTIEVIFKGIE
jgi:AcrR family transcriptional regulator